MSRTTITRVDPLFRDKLAQIKAKHGLSSSQVTKILANKLNGVDSFIKVRRKGQRKRDYVKVEGVFDEPFFRF